MSIERHHGKIKRPRPIEKQRHLATPHLINQIEHRAELQILNLVPTPIMIMKLNPESRRLEASHINAATRDIFPKLMNNDPQEKQEGKGLSELMTPDGAHRVEARIKELTKDNNSLIITHPAPQENGQMKWLKWKVTGVFNEKGEMGTVSFCGWDITDEQERNMSTSLQLNRIKAIINAVPSGIEWFNTKGILEDEGVNPATIDIFGVTHPEDLQGFELFKDPNLPKGLIAKIRKGEQVAYEHLFDFDKVKYETSKKGKRLLHVQIIPVEGNGYLVIVDDITEQNKNQEKLEHANTHDEPTGLYNRRKFDGELDKLSMKDDWALAIADVDNLKVLNDSEGHRAGDRLILKAAKVLQECIRSINVENISHNEKKRKSTKQDIVARIGGDEFGFIFYGCSKIDMEKILKRFNEKIKSAEISVSFGIAHSSEIEEKSRKKRDDVWLLADKRMYLEKFLKAKSFQSESLNLLIANLDIYEKGLTKHSFVVKELVHMFAESILLDKYDVWGAEISAWLHDVGKMRLSEEILTKKRENALSKDEWTQVKTHGTKGKQLIEMYLRKLIEGKPELEGKLVMILDSVEDSHENWDGSGYLGKSRKETAPYAHIIRLADSLAAIIRNNPGSEGKAIDTFINQLNQDEYKKNYDPELISPFIELIKKKRKKIVDLAFTPPSVPVE